MEQNYIITLPHLTNEMVVGARKTKLCAYSVALEGWRRGLTLKWYTIDSGKFDNMITFGVNPPGRLYSLSSSERTHYFFRTRGDKVTNEAVEIGAEKDVTKHYLSKAGVPVPEGGRFAKDVSDEEIVQFSTTIEYPLVLKPTNGSLGNGVVTNIKNQDQLRKALKYVRIELGYPDVIIEQFIPGEEYRVYVIEDQVIAAYNRLPANIVGDGIHTIAELIELKNLQRKRNARLHSCLIEIDQEVTDFIIEAGYTYESIPPKGEKIMLREKTNVSAGGDPVDVTDELPEEFKKVAINAVKAVPGLYHGGVDIIVNPYKPLADAAVVIELNPTAQIGGILFPTKGKSRDIPAAIIDYYFPETKGKKKENNAYFDLNTILEPLQSRSAVEVEVAPAPLGKMYAKKYVLTGSVSSESYHQLIKREALSRDLHGYVNSYVNGDIEVIISGTNKEEVNQFKNVLRNAPKKVRIKRIEEEAWRFPVKIGFEINEGFNVSSLSSTIRKMERELKRAQKEKKRLDKEIIKIEKSRSWRITTPLRKIEQFFINLFRTRKTI